jgi:hypothetical protein
MKKIFLFYFLLTVCLFGTPDKEDIVEMPLSFPDYDCCFEIKTDKSNLPFGYKFSSFREIMSFMTEYNLNVVYVRDCDKIKKWRKMTRKAN